jgi:hypothetical protein
MGEQKQSQGREDNAAAPVEDWQSKGATPKGKVNAEGKSFSPDPNRPQPNQSEDPNDLLGPAGDPVEGKRPGGSSWPA